MPKVQGGKVCIADSCGGFSSCWPALRQGGTRQRATVQASRRQQKQAHKGSKPHSVLCILSSLRDETVSVQSVD